MPRKLLYGDSGTSDFVDKFNELVDAVTDMENNGDSAIDEEILGDIAAAKTFTENNAVWATQEDIFTEGEILVGAGEGTGAHTGKKTKPSGYKIVNAPISKDITIPVGADAEVLDRESVEYGIREAMLHMMPLMIFKKGVTYGEGHEDYDKLVFKCTETGEGAIYGQTGTNDYYFNLFRRGFAPILVFGGNYSSLAAQIEWAGSILSSEMTLKVKIDHDLQFKDNVFYGFVMLARSTALFNSVLHPDAETIK